VQRPSSSLNHVAPDDMPEDMRKYHAASLDVVGEAERIEVFANHPALYRWYIDSFYGKLFDNQDATMVLDDRTKQLIRLKMSLTHGCFVCNRGNIPAAMSAGFSEAQIDAILFPSAELFTPAELAVLELGDQIAMQNLDGSLTPELYDRLRPHFSDAEILEMGVIAGMLTGWTKTMFTFDLVTREDNCPIGAGAHA
jgi:alkylhydroperoxidase family enzyme